MNTIFRQLSAVVAASLQRWRRTALRARLSTDGAAPSDPGRGWGQRSRHAVLAVAALLAFTALALLVWVLVLVPLTPSTHDLRSVKAEYPALLRSADGKELATFRRVNREWVKLSRISPSTIDALVAAEDHRFFEHHGIDFKRTAAAVFHTATGDRQGGSTITQQLARNLYPDDIGRSLTVTRKIKEAITAVKIESIYSKQEILETYLNTVPFLYNAYGIEMAARTYFDKSAHELTVLESATLVGMLKGTSYYNPVLNPERALKRRNLVLAQMVKHDKLAPARFEALKKQPLRLDFERQRDAVGMAPHVAEHLRKWLIEWADRNGHNLHADGLVIHTTIDSRLQGLANQAVARQAQALQAVADVEWGMRSAQVLSTDMAAYRQHRQRVAPFEHFWRSRGDLQDAFIRESDAYRTAVNAGLSDADALQRLKADADFIKAMRADKTRLQAGFVAIDPRNGHVKAWVGSRDFQQDPFDHVQQARRQPGSTFKPFVYAAAFEQGAKPGDTLVDRPVEIPLGNGETWRPNEGDATTGRAVSLRSALAQSKNTITAQLVQRVGAGRAAELAQAMGVRQSKLNPVPSLALGTSPVTLKEMVSGYATIANDGHYIEPVLVTRIEDRHGNVLATFEPQRQPALSRASAHALVDAMRGVIDSGTGTAIREHYRIQADVAGKTGTTQNNTDGWFILMHPHLVGGAWVGFNDNRVAMRSAHWGQGGHSALRVVGDFYQQALSTRAVDPRASFAAPREVDTVMPEPEPLPVARGVGGWLGSLFGTRREPDRKRGGSIPAGEIIPDG
jgi:penicillin-binding protein 1A